MKSRTETVIVRPGGRHDYVDLTEELQRAVKDAGVTEGCAVVFCAHTTANSFRRDGIDDRQQTSDALSGGGARKALMDDRPWLLVPFSSA